MPEREQSREPQPALDQANATPKIVLASEALREDVAPLRPAEREGRIVVLGVAIAFALEGIALRGGLGFLGETANASSIAFAASGALIAIAALPFPYGLRAVVASALGLFLVVVGARGVGPLAGMSADGGIIRDMTRLTAMCALPAALLFRAKYRVYRPARFVLALAMVLASPFLGVEGLLLSDSSAPFVTRAGGALDIIVVLCALSGFMGGYTTGAGSVLAAVVLWVLAGDLALRDLTPLVDPDVGTLVYTTTALGALGACVLVSLGFFQILSAMLANDARRTGTPKKTDDEAEASLA